MMALDLQDLHITIGKLQAVRGVDLRIAAGEMLCLVGESGSGKSLTALATMGLLPESADRQAGALQVMGADMRTASEPAWRKLRGDKVAMIFQDPTTSLDPVWSIGEQMIEGFRVHRPNFSRADALVRAAMMLARTGIDRPALRLRQYPHQLSGGMRQRVMIASALMTEPGLLIADEPTTALDANVQAQILELLAGLRRDFNLAILLITHDLAIAARHADKVAVMYAGEIVEAGPRAAIFANPWHPYTSALLACRPGGGQLGAIRGTVPSLAPPPPGCAFHDRCDHATADCVQPVAMVEQGDRAWRCVLGPRVVPQPRPVAASARAAFDGTEATFTLRDVSVGFASKSGLFRTSQTVQALRDITISVPRGGVLGIVGESGSGKSTLARVLLGLQLPDSGAVTLFGQALGKISRIELARQVQPVFQDPYSSLNPRRTIGDIIRLPLDVHRIGAPADRDATMRAMMARCGLLPALADARPGQLSGGQRQRAAIATALIMRPAIIICDEPTSALDVSVQAQILALLAELRAELGLTYVFISHDLAVVRSIADNVAVMCAGELVEHGPVAQVFSAPSHPYTQRLLEVA